MNRLATHYILNDSSGNVNENKSTDNVINIDHYLTNTKQPLTPLYVG